MPLTLLDYPVARANTTLVEGDATSYTLEFDAVPQGNIWRVDQVSVMVFNAGDTGFEPPDVLLYDQPVQPSVAPCQGTTLTHYLATATFFNYDFWADFDDQGSPLTIVGGDLLTIVFDSDLPAGAVCSARIQYGLYQGSSGDPTPVAGSQSPPLIPASL